ncbi:MAG: hypothetical protein Kow0075_02600 [Salibacteraceae bacterium]
MRVLFVALHRPNRSPSQRYRFEQYLDYLSDQGIQSELSYLLDEEDDKAFYSKGRLLSKAKILIKSYAKRLSDLKRLDHFDVVFVQREAFMTGTTFFEKAVHRIGEKMVFDFDDSIWIHNVSDANKYLNFLKNPAKTARIIGMAQKVVAGNKYLAQYALQYNDDVVIIPTTIDTDRYKRKVPHSTAPDKPVIIGWTGSPTTIRHFELAVPVLKQIKQRYGERVAFKVIGDDRYKNPELGITGIPWYAHSEVDDLQDVDIGIMPLPDDEWAKGKCALKGLQYMAVEIPAVMSPVGVNSEIIDHGTNGFLPAGHHEWVQILSQLIENPALRIEVGKAGRKTVERGFSVKANAEKYLNLFRSLS